MHYISNSIDGIPTLTKLMRKKHLQLTPDIQRSANTATLKLKALIDSCQFVCSMKQLQKKKIIGRIFSFRQEFMAFIVKIIAKTPIVHSFAWKFTSGSTVEFKLWLDLLVKSRCQCHVLVHVVDLLRQQFDLSTRRAVLISEIAFRWSNFRVVSLCNILAVMTTSADFGLSSSLLILSHSHVKVFSTNRQIVVQNMKEASFTALYSVQLKTMYFTLLVSMLRLSSSAVSRSKCYFEYVEEQKCITAKCACGKKKMSWKG